ncbi:MAG: hypothetical protein U1F00_21465 [Rhodoferax sp.]
MNRFRIGVAGAEPLLLVAGQRLDQVFVRPLALPVHAASVRPCCLQGPQVLGPDRRSVNGLPRGIVGNGQKIHSPFNFQKLILTGEFNVQPKKKPPCGGFL